MWGVPFYSGGGRQRKWGSAQSTAGLTGVEVPVGPVAPVGLLGLAVGPPAGLGRNPAKDQKKELSGLFG